METYHRRPSINIPSEAKNNGMIPTLARQLLDLQTNENSIADKHLEVGSFYTIDHTNLPTRTPVQLRCIQVVMVTEKTELNVSVRYPSSGSLCIYLSNIKISSIDIYPFLDEMFVMGTQLARKVLSRKISSQEFIENKKSEGFWLVNKSRSETTTPLMSQLIKSDGMVRWGVVRQVKFLRKHRDCSSQPQSASSFDKGEGKSELGLEEEGKEGEVKEVAKEKEVEAAEEVEEVEVEVELDKEEEEEQEEEEEEEQEQEQAEEEEIKEEVEDEEEEEEEEAKEEEGEEEEEEEEEGEGGGGGEEEEEEDEEEEEVEKENEDEDEEEEEEELVEEEDDDEEEEVVVEEEKDKEVEEENNNQNLKRKRKRRRKSYSLTNVNRKAKKPKHEAKKPKRENQRQVSKKSQTTCKNIVPGNSSRWSAQRYMLAQENLLVVMKEKNAVFDNPILRPALRAEARKLIGDTGLLDHLLKHVAGKIAPGGSERFRRRHNADGAMEFWLESADLVDIRREAGVQDPYWTPPPGWTPGDSPTQDPICARELKLLKDENAKLRRDMEESKMQYKKELRKLRREMEEYFSSKKKQEGSLAIEVPNLTPSAHS